MSAAVDAVVALVEGLDEAGFAELWNRLDLSISRTFPTGGCGEHVRYVGMRTALGIVPGDTVGAAWSGRWAADVRGWSQMSGNGGLGERRVVMPHDGLGLASRVARSPATGGVYLYVVSSHGRGWVARSDLKRAP